jgi:hypothetical protein
MTGPSGQPRSLSVHEVPAADFADRRDDLRIDASVAAGVVSCDLSLTQTKQGISSIEWAVASG